MKHIAGKACALEIMILSIIGKTHDIFNIAQTGKLGMIAPR